MYEIIKSFGNIIIQKDEWNQKDGCFVVYDKDIGDPKYKSLSFDNFEDAEKVFDVWVEIKIFYDYLLPTL